jgi:hypothetical protein
LDEITGVYRQKIFHSPDTNYLIAKLEDGGIVAGHTSLEAMVPGLTYRFTGQWQYNQKYQNQEFKFNGYARDVMISDTQIMSYATRYLFRANVGIGAARMRKVIAHKGPANCLMWLKACPEEVAEFLGITAEQSRAASRLLIDLESAEKTRLEVTALLENKGFPGSLIDHAIKELGAAAPAVIRRDPFTMMIRRWPGAGFDRCNALYLEQGRPPDGIKRQLMAVRHYIIRRGEGSTWVPVVDVLEHVRARVSVDVAPRRTLELGLRSRMLVCAHRAGQLHVAMFEDAKNEYDIHQHIIRLREPVIEL